MALADGTFVKGVRLLWSATSNGTFAALLDLTMIGATPTAKRPSVDFTPLDPSQDAREYKLGLATPSGEFPVEQLFTSARQVFWETHKANGDLLYWRVSYPDAALEVNRSHHDFAAYVVECPTKDKSNPDDKLMIAAKLQITGAVTFTGVTVP